MNSVRPTCPISRSLSSCSTFTGPAWPIVKGNDSIHLGEIIRFHYWFHYWKYMELFSCGVFGLRNGGTKTKTRHWPYFVVRKSLRYNLSWKLKDCERLVYTEIWYWINAFLPIQGVRPGRGDYFWNADQLVGYQGHSLDTVPRNEVPQHPRRSR